MERLKVRNDDGSACIGPNSMVLVIFVLPVPLAFHSLFLLNLIENMSLAFFVSNYYVVIAYDDHGYTEGSILD